MPRTKTTITEADGVLLGLLLAVTPIITPIHEIGHLLAAFAVGREAQWVQWNRVRVPSGVTFTIAMGGIAAETIVLLTVTIILLIKRRSGHWVFFYCWFINMLLHLRGSDQRAAAGVIGIIPVIIVLMHLTLVGWTFVAYRRTAKWIRNLPPSVTPQSSLSRSSGGTKPKPSSLAHRSTRNSEKLKTRRESVYGSRTRRSDRPSTAMFDSSPRFRRRPDGP